MTGERVERTIGSGRETVMTKERMTSFNTEEYVLGLIKKNTDE